MTSPRRGIMYMIASAFGFSVMSVLVKVASPRIPTGEIVCVRAAVTLAISFAMVKRANLSVWGSGAPGVRTKLAIRGLLGFGGLAGYYLALARLPIADAATLQNIVPILTAILAWWLLGERVGWPTVAALVCGTIGVLLVVRPSGTGLAHDPLGVAAALGGAGCSAFAYVTVRKLARTEHPNVIVLCFPMIALPLSIPWAAMDFVVPSVSDLVLLVGIGVATQVGQVFLTMGLAAERVASATAVNYVQIAFAMMWQLIIFGDAPALATMFGAGAIVLGTVINAATTDGSLARSNTSRRTPR